MYKAEINIFVKNNPEMFHNYPDYWFEPHKMTYVVESKFWFLLEIKTILKLWKLNKTWNDTPKNIHTTIYDKSPVIAICY